MVKRKRNQQSRQKECREGRKREEGRAGRREGGAGKEGGKSERMDEGLTVPALFSETLKRGALCGLMALGW